MIKRFLAIILLITITACSTVTFAAGVNLSDIDSSHWAYSAISELVNKGTVNGYPDGTFRPNGIVTYAEFQKMVTGVWTDNPAPIDREAALDMLWIHNGMPTNYSAPGIITNQMENHAAAAWGYSTGLMQGNDGLNLRPSDTLTRAEASMLIVRSSDTLPGDHSFSTVVSDDIAKVVWNNYGIFDSEYVADETITADELQVATKKLGKFKTFSTTVDSVTVDDVATLLLYGAITRANISVSVVSVDGITEKYGTVAKIYAAYGFENGVVLPADASAIATKRDIALLLMQIDDLVGKDGAKINKNVAAYPANYKDYPYLDESIPAAVYAVPFDNGAKPVDFYHFTSIYTFIFENFVNDMESNYGKDKVDFTLIPSLISQNDKTEAILRVKCTLTGATAYELFGAGYENAGDVFYMDIHTGEPVLNIYIPTEIAKIGKFVCNQ